jgi:hypothetical protein
MAIGFQKALGAIKRADLSSVKRYAALYQRCFGSKRLDALCEQFALPGDSATPDRVYENHKGNEFIRAAVAEIYP